MVIILYRAWVQSWDMAQVQQQRNWNPQSTAPSIVCRIVTVQRTNVSASKFMQPAADQKNRIIKLHLGPVKEIQPKQHLPVTSVFVNKPMQQTERLDQLPAICFAKWRQFLSFTRQNMIMILIAECPYRRCGTTKDSKASLFHSTCTSICAIKTSFKAASTYQWKYYTLWNTSYHTSKNWPSSTLQYAFGHVGGRKLTVMMTGMSE